MQEEELTFDEVKHQYRYKGKAIPSVTEICSILTASKYGELNPSILASAQLRGTAVHELTEAVDYDAEPDEIDLGLLPYIIAYKRFLRDYDPDWIGIEKMVGNEFFAGTIDRVGMIDGVPLIVDLKTTSTMDRLSKMALCCQLCGYAYLWEQNTGQHIDYQKCFGIQLKPDGTYSRIDVEDCEKSYSFDTRELFGKLQVITAYIRGKKK